MDRTVAIGIQDFEKLSIWKQEEFRELQGSYPVISLSFANVKEMDMRSAKQKICQLITDVYVQYDFLRDSKVLTDKDQAFFAQVSMNMEDSVATLALYRMSDFLYRYYGKRSLFCWMNMIRQCRKLMSEGIEMN